MTYESEAILLREFLIRILAQGYTLQLGETRWEFSRVDPASGEMHTYVNGLGGLTTVEILECRELGLFLRDMESRVRPACE